MPSPASDIRISDRSISGGLQPINAYRLGWQPKWDEQMFLNRADEEVQAILDGNTIRTSIFEKVMTDPAI
jgi:hypothetical protein